MSFAPATLTDIQSWERGVTPEPSADQVTKGMAERMFLVRGQKVILDSDLAALYHVPTKRLNEQVRRYPERFPPDFLFLLSSEEWESLRSQIAASRRGRRPRRRFLPYVFTEAGAYMASTVLTSARAIEISISVVRAL